MGEDYKCSQTENCAQSENGECIKCSKDYYLGNDKKCTNIEHCIYSGSYYYHLCDECEENYYYDSLNMTCKKETENFTNCKFSSDGTKCTICRDNHYLNKSDYLCYDNTKEDSKY